MNKLFFLVALAVISACSTPADKPVDESKTAIGQYDVVSVPDTVLNQAYEAEKDTSYLNETIDGWLSLDTKQAKVLEELGQAENKGTDEMWGATGTYVEAWNYPSKGIELQMESVEQGGEKYVLSVYLSGAFVGKTSRGIAIGTFRQEVLKKYPGLSTEYNDENSLVVGSVYGGIIYNFDNNKVTSIFIGAAAE